MTAVTLLQVETFDSVRLSRQVPQQASPSRKSLKEAPMGSMLIGSSPSRLTAPLRLGRPLQALPARMKQPG